MVRSLSLRYHRISQDIIRYSRISPDIPAFTSTYQYVPVHTGTHYCIPVPTSRAWHEVLSVLPHNAILRTLCKMLCEFSNFHLDFSPDLSGRFCWRRLRRSTAFCWKLGSSDSGIWDWQDAIFQSMHLMITSTTLLLGSEHVFKRADETLPWRYQ